MATIFDWLSSLRSDKATINKSPTTVEEYGATQTPFTPIKTVKVSTSGTEIYAGYIEEEYLRELRGTKWAELADKMQRSDPVVRMALQAISLPITSANWYIKAKDDSQEAEIQKRLLEKALFEDLDETFTKLLSEIMTLLRCGYSLFEITHKVKMNDPELGSYTTIASLGWRSQKTIEQWGVDANGRLLWVEQRSYGDVGRQIKIPAEFLIHFCPSMEGNNYEGFSILRPLYGAWLRKNAFLKQNAIGNERGGTPTPVLKVPKGIEGSEEYAAAVEMMANYTSAKQNGIILPEGWEITFNNTTYDPSRAVPVLDYEDGQMAKGILAQFLMLGQASNGGSMALGGTLQEFFTQSIQYLVDHIVETMHKRCLDNLIRMNLGNVEILAELACDSLDEKASESWVNMLSVLRNAGFVSQNAADEVYIRSRLKMPELQEQEQTGDEA